ncbi:class III lanthionine synthetase LanKC N-terminal domain-containing protein [Pediococcus pentosaceus]|uniref:RamC N-terminal domain-containing protein n=1 Tax=Pediococcus pentosaceus TaxID=1255 RepID=A0AA41C105_PEDPE|nr:hypothetical protein [Pediococcus pentosaceus]MBF7128077.1 hypothetical protein [Pediococcus pentosaceus]
MSGDCPVSAFGKLITIYPNTVEDFVLIAKELYSKLKQYHGPYVLSDNAVYNSEVLYYRYGAIDRDDGNLIDYETNKVIKDNRMYFEVPSFVDDPLNYEDDSQSKIINNTVFPERIINTSSAGNTYLGKFQDRNVVIKEARNLVIGSKGYTLLAVLKNRGLEFLEWKYFPTPKILDPEKGAGRQAAYQLQIS